MTSTTTSDISDVNLKELDVSVAVVRKETVPAQVSVRLCMRCVFHMRCPCLHCLTYAIVSIPNRRFNYWPQFMTNTRRTPLFHVAQNEDDTIGRALNLNANCRLECESNSPLSEQLQMMSTNTNASTKAYNVEVQ